MKQKIHLVFTLALIMSMAAACTPFGTTKQSLGILRSDNGGVDFAATNKIEGTEATDLSGIGIYKLGFSPGSNTIMFAATQTAGLYKSTNAGTSWKQVFPAAAVRDFAIDPEDVTHMYVAVEQNSRTRLLESKNDGGTWQEIYTQNALSDPVVGVKINPANTSNLLALLKSGVLVRSEDSGQTWSQVYNFQTEGNWISWSPSGIYILTRQNGLFKSTNGGTVFTEVTAPLKPKDFTVAKVINLPAGKSIYSFNSFAVAGSNPNLIYLSTDAGLLQTRDGGKTWTYILLPAKKDYTENISQVAISDANTNIVYVASGDTMYRSVNLGGSWQVRTMPGATAVGFILPHPEKLDTIYVGMFPRLNNLAF